jgi:hypothetical protein
MGAIAAHGINVTLPGGWDGRITVRDDGAPSGLIAAAGNRVEVLRSHPVVHLANFGLPGERGDFGSGAVELMGDRDVFIVLFEYEPAATATALFQDHGLPRTLQPRDFEPATLRRGIVGQTAHQAFFQEQGRAFCLYVVLGSQARRAALAPIVNRVLATVQIAPRVAG